MQAIATEPRLMPHLHLSLQAGDDMILKRMKRRHLRDDAIAFCEEARRLRPDMVFGADLIAGFPTETEAMFENSLQLVDDCDLTFLHVFPFQPAQRHPRRPDAAGARPRHQDPRRPPARRRRRRAGPPSGRPDRAERHRVLIEGPRLGRTEQFTEVAFATDQPEGQILRATITGACAGRLIA